MEKQNKWLPQSVTYFDCFSFCLNIEHYKMKTESDYVIDVSTNTLLK